MGRERNYRRSVGIAQFICSVGTVLLTASKTVRCCRLVSCWWLGEVTKRWSRRPIAKSVVLFFFTRPDCVKSVFCMSSLSLSLSVCLSVCLSLSLSLPIHLLFLLVRLSVWSCLCQCTSVKVICIFIVKRSCRVRQCTVELPAVPV